MNMSEWKNRVDSTEYDTEQYCTGWGIVDGIINCIRNIKKRRQIKKSLKPNN